MKTEEVSSGIFISFLKRRVCEDEKVTVMLDRVAEGTIGTGQAVSSPFYREDMIRIVIR